MASATTKRGKPPRGRNEPIPAVNLQRTRAAQRILVVDDNLDILHFMQAALETAGYEVQTAAEGAQALVLLAQRHAGLLITDIFMPGRDGIETLRDCRIRFPETRIIVMSGGGGRQLDYLPAAELIGADATLRKPFAVEQLLDTVQKVLGS